MTIFRQGRWREATARREQSEPVKNIIATPGKFEVRILFEIIELLAPDKSGWIIILYI
ncbi:MAG: hypothetical protein AAF378_16195 [Cyanobacteria bacterium P01_A01_bin.84]